MTILKFGTLIGGVSTILGSISLGADSETGSTLFSSNVVIVGDSIWIQYGGSGGVDSLVLAPVPLPAAGFMRLAGLGDFASLKRRKKRAA